MFCLCSAFHRSFVVVSGGNKVGQNPASVDSLPFKGIVRHFVEFIPADFCGHEIRHFAFLQNLGQSRGISENIRQPENGIVFSEFFPEKCLSVNDLAHQSFSGSDVAVRLNKHSAFRLPSALCDPFLDLFIYFRRMSLYIFVKLRLAGHKNIFRIFFHQIQNCGKASYCFILCHFQRPHPCAVNMSVSHTAHHRSLVFIAMLFIKFFGNIFLSLFQAVIIFLRTFPSHIQKIQGIIQRLDDRDICPVLRIQQTRGLIGHRQIVEILFCLSVQNFQFGIQLQAEILVSGKRGKSDPVYRSCLCFFSENDLPVIDIQSLHQFSVDIDGKLRVCGIPFTLSSCDQFIDHTLLIKLLRNGHCGFKPVILPVSSPDLLPVEVLPGRSVQIFHRVKSPVCFHHFVVLDIQSLRIDLLFQIFQHFSDSFLDENHSFLPPSVRLFPRAESQAEMLAFPFGNCREGQMLCSLLQSI